jgi:hypothetical protein
MLSPPVKAMIERHCQYGSTRSVAIDSRQRLAGRQLQDRREAHGRVITNGRNSRLILWAHLPWPRRQRHKIDLPQILRHVACHDAGYVGCRQLVPKNFPSVMKREHILDKQKESLP